MLPFCFQPSIIPLLATPIPRSHYDFTLLLLRISLSVYFDRPSELAMAPHGPSRPNHLQISSKSHTNRTSPTEHIRLQRKNLKPI